MDKAILLLCAHALFVSGGAMVAVLAVGSVAGLSLGLHGAVGIGAAVGFFVLGVLVIRVSWRIGGEG